MKIEEIYRLAVKMGIEADPRGKKDVQIALDRTKVQFEEMKDEEKEYFDHEKFWNPYSDTRVLYGSYDTEVKRAMVGVDVEVSELVLADHLRSKGEKIDLIIAHHPEGKALAELSEVMSLQADLWERHGVPINVGEALLDKRIGEVKRNFLPINHQRAIDAARLLDFPFMCIHTAADNNVAKYLQKYIDDKKPYLVKDVIKVLLEQPEYKKAKKEGAGPTIIQGKEEARCGKVVVDMTGGTEGPSEMMEKLSLAGVGTLIQMHAAEKIREEAEKSKINMIIAGHIASDVIGLNLILDKLEKRGMEFLTFSGVTRVKRS